jgi:hypothetical protein
MANQVLGVGVAFVDQGKNVVHVVDYDTSGFGNVMESENAFWNMFEKKLPKYKDRLDIIFLCHIF